MDIKLNNHFGRPNFNYLHEDGYDSELQTYSLNLKHLYYYFLFRIGFDLYDRHYLLMEGSVLINCD